MAFIWRIEGERTGYGAYQTGAAAHALEKAGGSWKRHPTPDSDARLKDAWRALGDGGRGKWYFGFATLEQYRNWFYTRDIRKRLAEFEGWCGERMVLRKYRVPSRAFHRGMNQAIYLRTEAVLVEERAPDFC